MRKARAIQALILHQSGKQLLLSVLQQGDEQWRLKRRCPESALTSREKAPEAKCPPIATCDGTCGVASQAMQSRTPVAAIALMLDRQPIDQMSATSYMQGKDQS